MNERTRWLLPLLLVSSPVLAQTSLEELSPRHVVTHDYEASVLTGRTVGADRFVVHGELGYPGLDVALLWGQSSRFDAGFRLSAGYGTRLGVGIAPGFGAQAVLRWNFVDTGKLSFGARFEPGAFVTATNPGNAMLLAPVGLSLGIHPHPIVSVAVGADVGVGAIVDQLGRASFVVPLELGPGVEVNLTDALALTFDTRVGFGWSQPWPQWGGYGFRAALGLAFKV